MPLTEKGETIKRNMEEHYGVKKGENVFYASKNKGTITGIDSAKRRYHAFRDALSKGMSLDKALAVADGGGPDIEQPIEGAKAVYETTKGAAHSVVGDEDAGIDVVSGGGEVGSDPKPPAMPKQEGITTPEATEPAVPATKDAKRRFRAAVIDAVRANVPLPKLIELGVISGVSGLKKQTPDYPITSDSFRRSFKAVVAKGFSTTDALWLVLRR